MIGFKIPGRRAALFAAGSLAAVLLAGCESPVLTEKAPAFGPEACAPPTPGQPVEFGCANRANLAAMVANPADLEEGHPLSPASGAREAAAVDAYKKGQAKPLNPSATASGPTINFGTSANTGNH